MTDKAIVNNKPLTSNKVGDEIQFVPNISSLQGGGLQLWMNALQSGKDVHCNLTTENGQIKITLVDPDEIIQNGDPKMTDVKVLDLFANDEIVDADCDDVEEWGFFLQDHTKIVAQPVKNVQDDILNQIVCEEFEEISDVADDFKESTVHCSIATAEKRKNSNSECDISPKISRISFEEDGSSFQEINENNLASADIAKSTIVVTVASDDEERNNERYYPANPNIFPCIRNEWYVSNIQEIKDGGLTSDLFEINTMSLASDLRNFLRHHSISLASFSKIYLDRSQGTLSDLLNHPKPWINLNARGRSIYLKMLKFLSSKDLFHKVQKLKQGNEKGRRGPISDSLPAELMSMLAEKVMPSKDVIEKISKDFRLNPAYLISYCESQVRLSSESLDVIVEFEDDQLHCDTQEDNKVTNRQSNMKHLSADNMKLSKHNYMPRPCERQICPVLGCGSILSAKYALKNHLITHSKLRSHSCKQCDKTFVSLAYLRSHEKLHSSQRKISKRARKAAMLRIISGLVEFETKKSQNCKIDKDSKNKCVEKVDKSSVRCSYACGVCSLSFENLELLRAHVVDDHASARFFVCALCKKCFKSAESLHAHQRTHRNSLKYDCQFCKKRFQTKFNLKRHLLSHNGSKPYSCSQCPSRFNDLNVLATHMRIHTGEKPFKCNVCGAFFAQRGTLQSHMLLHTDVRPFICATCGKAFRQKTNLLSHEKRHSSARSHLCKTCGSSFVTEGDLQRHILTHNKDRRFVCSKCSMSYTRLSYLTEHVQKVHNLSPFRCKRCGLGFSSKTTYLNHTLNACHISMEEKRLEKEGHRTDEINTEPSNSTFPSILQPFPDSMFETNRVSDGDLLQTQSININENPASSRYSEETVPFAFRPDSTIPIAVVTDRGFVLAPSTVETEQAGAESSESFGFLSKLAIGQDDSDPNMHSVIVSPEDYERLQDGTSYVMLKVADDITVLHTNSGIGDS